MVYADLFFLNIQGSHDQEYRSSGPYQYESVMQILEQTGCHQQNRKKQQSEVGLPVLLSAPEGDRQK